MTSGLEILTFLDASQGSLVKGGAKRAVARCNGVFVVVAAKTAGGEFKAQVPSGLLRERCLCHPRHTTP